MILTFKLAYKNLIGAGLRTWLNVFVTAISFFLIVFMSGMYQGMEEHSLQVMIDTEIAGGAYWHPEYDPADPIALDDAHGIPPLPVAELIETGAAVPVLISQAAIYPNGRIRPVLMKGTIPGQTILDFPSSTLEGYAGADIPVLVGVGMAKSNNLKEGDTFIIRWLDANRTYDAQEGIVVAVMQTENFQIDMGQIWVPIDRMQQMLSTPGEATYVTYAQKVEPLNETDGWIHRDAAYLNRHMKALIDADRQSAPILYGILLALAAMGIFNSQVLTIFRRQKEIGTLMALGMTRSKVVSLFTTEGGINAFLALIMTIVLGGPVLYWSATTGVPLMELYGMGDLDAGEWGVIMAARLVSAYSMNLFVGTTILVSIIVLIVSYIPARKIAKMKPTDALRGKVW
ncbi:ABC transporter permease [Candidatus Neomarinimicrobiota bacterium]